VQLVLVFAQIDTQIHAPPCRALAARHKKMLSVRRLQIADRSIPKESHCRRALSGNPDGSQLN